MTLPAVARRKRWRFTFKARNARAKAPVARRTFVLRAPPFAISENWAGYAVASKKRITEASGQFKVPTLNCAHTPNGSEATWVGIGGDGAASGDLLQTGVDSNCVNGSQVENPAWWEEYPEYSSFDFQSMAVSPGDQMQASVYRAGDGSWFTRLDDRTTGDSGVMHTGDGWGTVSDSDPTSWLVKEGDASAVSYAGGHTAEWIVEDIGRSDGTHVPFADFRTVAFDNLTTSLTSWSLTADEALGIGERLLLAAPSAPEPSGHGFSVTFTG